MSSREHNSPHRWELIALIAILALAAALRLWRLDTVPPGLTHDEAGHGHDAVAILNGARPIYQTVGYGREPLFDYFVAGLTKLLGNASRALRLSSVPLGLVSLIATFAWVHLAFGGATALTAVAFQAASFWSLSTGRQALRSSLLPPLFASAVYFYWRALLEPRQASDRTPCLWRLTMFTLLIGATLYTYIPARILLLVFIAFLVYLAVAHVQKAKSLLAPSVIALMVSLLLALPLLTYLRAHPEAEQRLVMLSAPLDALRSGDLSVILNNAGECIAAYFIPGYGDDFVAYNLPGRPVFNPLTGGLFLMGLGLSLARWRRPSYAFSLIWFLIGISPSLVTGATASTTRSIGALPVVFLFPALTVVAGIRWARSRGGETLARVIALSSVALILTTAVLSAHDYFVSWGESVDVRAAYRHTLVEIAHYVDKEIDDGPVVISTVHPSAPHDPYVFEMSIPRNGISVRWVDARRALVLPQTSTAQLITPASAPLSPYLATLPGIDPLERLFLHADDLDPYFQVYSWRPRITLAALQDRVQEHGLYLDADEATHLEAPINFGNVLQLLGYDIVTPVMASEGSLGFITLWQATNPVALRPIELSDVGSEWLFFIHAVDSKGSIVVQEDRLDAPTWSWRTNDVIVQIHRLELPSNSDLDSVTLEIGVFHRSELKRLPIMLNETAVGDRLLVQASGRTHP